MKPKAARIISLSLKILLPMLVIAVGVAVFLFLVKTKPHAEKRNIVRLDPLVEIVEVTQGSQTVTISGMGTVVTARKSVVQPEVSGRIVELNEALVRGGRLTAGDTLLRVDPRNYELVVEQQKVNVARAKFEAKLEKGKRRVAKREWQLLGDDIDRSNADEDMALRKPHSENAEAAIQGATAALERAELDVERTELEVPFNAMVKQEGVEVGQLVTPQMQVATLIGTDEFWVEVAVPADSLLWIDVPGMNADSGSTALVRYAVGAGVESVREGQVVRLLSEIDPVGRMVRLVVSVPNPFDVTESAPIPLLEGAYVNVDIEGRTADDVIALPRKGLREGHQAWVVDNARRLHIRDLEILWRRGDDVLVKDGIEAGERVVLTRLSSPAKDMGLRILDELFIEYLARRLWFALPESWRILLFEADWPDPVEEEAP